MYWSYMKVQGLNLNKYENIWGFFYINKSMEMNRERRLFNQELLITCADIEGGVSI